ncbi:MAG: ABC transporter ATP-binding protein [Pseudomonadota bacterium]
MTASAAIALSEVQFAYPKGPTIIDIQEFALPRGQSAFLEGPSGSGKSTLLGLIGGILKADSGRVEVLGQALDELSATARDRFRANHVGFVFQLFNLLPYLSLLDNVTLPCRFSTARLASATEDGKSLKARATDLLDRLGLPAAYYARPVTQLSVGQQQRVAVARALIGAPALVVADEPTSALDARARQRFVELLLEESSRAGTSVLFVSHDPGLAPEFDVSLSLSDINRASVDHE